MESIEAKLTLTNGVPQQWCGGAGVIVVNGDINSGTIDFSFSDEETPVNYVPLDQQLTDIGILVFGLPRGVWLKADFGGSPNVTIKVYREAGLHAFVKSSGGGSSGGSGGPSSDVNIANFGGSAVSKGQKNQANSIPVVLPSDADPFEFAAADMLEVSGTISSAAVLSNFPITDLTGYYSLALQITVLGSGNTLVVEESNDGTTWTNVPSVDGVTSQTAVGFYRYNLAGKQCRVRASVHVTGSSTVRAEFRSTRFAPLDVPTATLQASANTKLDSIIAALGGSLTVGLPSGASTAANQTSANTKLDSIITALGGTLTVGLPSGAATAANQSSANTKLDTLHTDLGTINTTLGSPMQNSGGSVTANAGTNLNTSALALETGGNLATVATNTGGTNTRLGALTDAKNTATDTTSVSIVSILKQISASIQAAAASLAGSLTVATHAVTQSGSWVLSAGTALIGYVGHGKTMKSVSGSLTSDTDVIAAVSSKRLMVYAYRFTSVGTNGNPILFKSNGTGGTEIWREFLQGATGVPYGAAMAISPPGALFGTASGEKLTLDVGNGDTVHYSISYWEE